MLFIFAAGISSCDIINPEEEIPSYLHVPKARLITYAAAEGPPTHNITDVWAFSDGEALGAFEMPVTFPLLKAGATNITLLAGIKSNGVSATRVVYPFYTQFDTTLLLERTVADTLIPTFRYTDNLAFPVFEDFESGSILTNLSVQPDTFGNAGVMTADAANPQVVAVSTDYFTLPNDGREIFLELDYKNTHVFDVGLLVLQGGQTSSLYKLSIAPRSYWNKIYINFTPEIGRLQATSYKLIFNLSLQEGEAPASVSLDNIKMVHFN